MDQDKLIANVKAYEPLYVTSHPKYSDSGYKENLWKAIAKEMNQSVAVCKKIWTNLRDSFRRAMKKRRETKSGQAASKIKKWKFEDEMSFLLPFMQERDTCSNLKDVSDDDDENNEEESQETEDDGKNKLDDDGINNTDDVDGQLHIEDGRKEKELSRKIVNAARRKGTRNQTQPETASAVMMKYLLNKKATKEQSTQQPNAIDTFFSSIATTVKSFSPYHQNVAKSHIFSIVSDLEMKQIVQPPQFFSNNTPTQRPQYVPTQFQSISVPSPSPTPSSSTLQTTSSSSSSRIATPIQSPPCYDFPSSISMQHLNQETIYTENM
ncbi:transcription factor Adf-1-like [Photinus pyralis]|uniref:transcription factor Adf-1-like n=1 Tax=Photinus pyralis TaxID=7054 RepID=UPI0012670A72|nr:transcription factor Adf-1-like [Photinus pyralis]